MYNETIQRLEKFTDAGEFERLGCDLLSRLGFRGIEPQGVGRKDGGKDALHTADDQKTVIHFSLRQDWDKKLSEDLETTKRGGGNYTKFVFVSNRSIPPIQRDQFKERISKEYGWEPVIMDQEHLRVELDNHSRDLRRKYLGIAEDYASGIDEIIEEFIHDRNEISNYLSKAHYQRILFLSIPSEMRDNRMKLFDEDEKFVGDKDKLKAILGRNLPSPDFECSVRSNSFSTNLELNRTVYFPVYVPHEPNIFEANLYNNGIIEILFDAEETPINQVFEKLLSDFLLTVGQLYAGLVGKEEFITLSVVFINSTRMEMEKKGEPFCGEQYYFSHQTEERFGAILTIGFQKSFAKTLLNKTDNFFNKKA